MKLCLFSAMVVFALAVPATAAEKDDRLYELRVYYAAEGKLDALNARFRDHTTKLFEKHGMTNVGYWTPVENPDRKLIYLLSYPTREAARESWKAFLADPDWQKAARESERDGRLVAKIESTFLTTTDYSPAIKPATAPEGGGDRVFELRTYMTTPGNLNRLHARFRNHTTKLFEKHGMTNVGYWSPVKDQKAADSTLIYILAHKSMDAAKASFDAFRKDPDWIAAKGASEKEAGGSLTAKDGVKSEFLKATDYSPVR
jgi:hypothetical protein